MYAIVSGVTGAEARVRHFIAGVDTEAIAGILSGYPPRADGRGRAFVTRASQGFLSSRLVGSAASIRQQIEETIRATDLDGMMLIFPDYIEDLRFFGEEILPGLRQAFRGGKAA